ARREGKNAQPEGLHSSIRRDISTICRASINPIAGKRPLRTNFEHCTKSVSGAFDMYDLRTYLATKDLPGGPVYIEEQFTAEYQLMNPQITDSSDDRPLTPGRAIGGLISLVLLVGTGVYLFVAW
ncbi:hypothetical protein, partial [Pseudomonas canadensis]